MRLHGDVEVMRLEPTTSTSRTHIRWTPTDGQMASGVMVYLDVVRVIALPADAGCLTAMLRQSAAVATIAILAVAPAVALDLSRSISPTSRGPGSGRPARAAAAPP